VPYLQAQRGPSGDASPLATPRAAGSSDELYGPYMMVGTGKYILGEAYASLGSSTSRAGTAQKLLQLERILCFFLAKHSGGDSILDCVAVVFLFGPFLDPATCDLLFRAIVQSAAALPLLYELFCNNLLIALATPHSSFADVNTFLLSLDVAELRAEVGKLGTVITEMREEQREMREEQREMKMLLQRISNAFVPVPP
jgi:hypothetical protein